MARIGLELTVHKEQPLAVRRPTWAEVQMIGVTGHEDAVTAVDVASPNLIAARTGDMVGHPSAIRAEAHAVRKPLGQAREFPCIAAIQVHAENLAALVAHH